MNRWAFFGYGALLLAITVALDARNISRCGDGLSPWDIGDPFSEANALRAGERYARDGFIVDCGLPATLHGDRFGTEGALGAMRAKLGKDVVFPEDPVYKGYPPGPDWLCGVYTKLLGVDHVREFRYFPVGLNIVACAGLLVVLARVFGRWRALGVYLACLVAPMLTAHSQSLHHQGYALSLLLIELALVMSVIHRYGTAGPATLAALFSIGFVQGWISWDYCFLVTFASVPIALLVTPADGPVPWRNVLAQVVVAGAGFTLAHILHFAEIAIYMGNLREALDEFSNRSVKKYEVADLLEGLSFTGRIKLGMKRYYEAYVGPDHFSRAGRLVIYATAAILFLRQAELRLGGYKLSITVTRPSWRDLAAIVLAIAIGLAWLFAKTYHAVNHYFFIIRHFFLFYLVCCIVIARAIEVTIARVVPLEQADTRPALIGETQPA